MTRAHLVGVAAALLILAAGWHMLAALGEAAAALGALLNNDAHYESISSAYQASFAIVVAIAVATVLLMLAYLRGPDRAESTKAEHLPWALVALGTVTAAIGYLMAVEAAGDHVGETLGPSNRLGAETIMPGALIDLVGSLVVLLGAACCLLLLRRRPEEPRPARAPDRSS